MWSLNQRSFAPWTDTPLHPETIFYEFEEPLIFSGWLGPQYCLFYKFDETDDNSLYLTCDIDEARFNYLGQGKLSVRGAIERSDYIILETTPLLVIKRFWRCRATEFPKHFLPKERVALYPNLPAVPDHVEQIEAYFAIGFKGIGLHSTEMRFSTFKNLINDAYDAARRLLSPIQLAGSKAATFDFQMLEPKFGSLIIALKEPVLDATNVRRRLADTEFGVQDVDRMIEEQRAAFFSQLSGVISDAKTQKIKSQVSVSSYNMLKHIGPLMPSEDSDIDSVEFNSNVNGFEFNLEIDRATAQTIRTAFRRHEGDVTFETGTLRIINGHSLTFVLDLFSGKQLTCKINKDALNRLEADGRFKYGARIAVRGILYVRKVRDYMDVIAWPRILAGPVDE
jgi:hypothetical protein